MCMSGEYSTWNHIGCYLIGYRLRVLRTMVEDDVAIAGLEILYGIAEAGLSTNKIIYSGD